MPRGGSGATWAEDREALFADIEDLLYLGERGMARIAERCGYRNPSSLERHLLRHRPDLIPRIRGKE